MISSSRVSGSAQNQWKMSCYSSGGKQPQPWVSLYLQGLSTDEDALIDIICSRSNEDLAGIIATYKNSNCVHN